MDFFEDIFGDLFEGRDKKRRGRLQGEHAGNDKHEESGQQSGFDYDDHNTGVNSAVVNCSNCGKPNPRSANFCMHCGSKVLTQVKKFCTGCGMEQKEAFRFCPSCGVEQA